MLSTILTFLLVLSILVLVHELGHFIVARLAGVWVEEFGFGIPPRIVGKKIGNTIYSINLLPFGGFVRLHGESSDQGIKKPKKAFLNKSKVQRLGILLAGVAMNFLLAVVAFGIVYSLTGVPRESKNVKIVDIAAGSPAQISGLVVGDVVRKVGSEEVETTQEFITLIELEKGNKVQIEIDSGKKIIVSPRENPPEGEGPLGVAISTMEIYFPPIWQRPFYGAYYGFQDAYFWGREVVGGIGTVLSGLSRGQAPRDLAGPVGIYALTSEVSKFGTLALIHFVGILSVNLAILNILPFPALDGGRVLFVIIETFIGKRITPKVEAAFHTVGMAILLFLLLAITARDIQRLISAGSLSSFVEGVLR